MLELKHLYVSGRTERGRERIILKDINLKIGKGEVYALLGPNGSGKSTLAAAIMGLPDVKTIRGSIIFNGRDVTHAKPEKRARLGIALAFQHPPEIKGVRLSRFIREILKENSEEYQRVLALFSEHFGERTVKHLLDREINVSFSGGEKKLSELIQLIALKPKFIVLDEMDSGLDVRVTESITKIIKHAFIDARVSILLITHRGSILRFLNPDRTGVMLHGEIVCESCDWKKIWKTIARCGYEKCKTCRYEGSG